MAKIYYHTPNQTGNGITIWSAAKSLTAAGQELARINAVWPDKSTDGQTITVGKRHGRDIYPVKQYRLDGNKLVRVGS